MPCLEAVCVRPRRVRYDIMNVVIQVLVAVSKEPDSILPGVVDFVAYHDIVIAVHFNAAIGRNVVNGEAFNAVIVSLDTEATHLYFTVCNQG